MYLSKIYLMINQWKFLTKSKIKMKLLITHNLILLAHLKNIIFILSFGSLAENIYNGNISLDTAKQKQRKMQDMLESFINYSLIKNMYKRKKANVLLNAKEFYKGRRNILIAFEENTFPLPKPYVFGKNEWKEKDIPINETFMPKTFKLSFLEKNNQNELSEKENELLHRDFGYKNIDELIAAFNNIKTDDEFPVQEKDFIKIERKNNICINLFVCENKIVSPIYISDQKFEDSMDLFLLIDNDKSHYVYIKDFNRFMFQ